MAAAVLDALLPLAFAALAVLALVLTRVPGCSGDPSATDAGARCGTGASALGVVLFLAAWLAALAIAFWNLGLRQGRTGSSVGKAALRCRVLGAADGRPIGVGRGVLRMLCQVSGPLTAGLGWLWLLWDPRRQTFTDKLVVTVCVDRAAGAVPVGR